jgi:hypothetical protein
MAQAVEHQLCKCKALNLNPSSTKKTLKMMNMNSIRTREGADRIT